MTEFNGFDEFATILEEFADDLEEIGDDVIEAIDEGTRKTAQQVEGTAKRRVNVDTGETRADIKATKLDAALYSVGSTKEHAPPLEYGSRPHPITPNGDYPLVFEKDGQVIATYHVDHPGTTPHPFIRPALNQHRSDLVENIQEEIEALIDAQL